MANPCYHTNLFAPLFTIAVGMDENDPQPNMTAYQSDLGWDAITLSRSAPGDTFLWAWRNWGTHLVRVEEGNWRNVIGMLKHNMIPMTNWYVIRVAKVSEVGCASGTIEHIGRSDREELIEYVRRILVEQIKNDLSVTEDDPAYDDDGRFRSDADYGAGH